MQGFTYSVDLVLCIDATGSMGPIIGRVKDSALNFYEDLQQIMEDKSKVVDSMRIRVIAFRDFYCDGDKSLEASTLFSLPADREAFAAFVSGITADGGGDEPETGLEALAVAMSSPWTTTGAKRRQVIVVWTDASCHPLEKSDGAKPPNYPGQLPKSFDALTDMWEGSGYMDPNAKRLILYAPDAYAWTDMANNWENVLH
ncbi:MAG: vWA domain-containing protein, partial [Acidimicrobiales bacterium]